ncbi:MAG: helix-turn-helix domain-containing protein [Candidatus Binatus sp.]
MAKSNFMDWLDRETARRGIDEKEIAALVDQMMVEDQLTALRLKRGISQSALADLMGVTQPLVARIEAGGVKNLTLATIARTAAALGGRIQLKIRPAKGARRAGRRALTR